MSVHIPSFTRRQWGIASSVFMLLALVAVLIIRFDIDWETITRAMSRVSTPTMLVLTTLLPLVGLPISLVYILIGARFGPNDGLLMVAIITVLHLLGTHLIGRGLFRRPLERFMQRRKHHIPEVPRGENLAMSLMILLTPAIPYFIRNYVLALSGIPLRVYFFVALPVHVLRSYVALFIGDFGSAPSQRGFALIVIFYAAQFAILTAVLCWLRVRHKRKAAEAGAAAHRDHAAFASK